MAMMVCNFVILYYVLHLASIIIIMRKLQIITFIVY